MKSQPLASVAGRITNDAMNQAFKTIENGGPNWFVYMNGDQKDDHLEDEGRTQVKHVQGLPEKVYAILEDYGDPAEWVDMYGDVVATTLKAAIGDKRHKLTIMFSSDY